MAFIDWSDPEELFGLLVEYVADERAESQADLSRKHFLERLFSELINLQETFNDLSISETLGSLRNIAGSIDKEFEDDPVTEHLEACIEELERIDA